jgi:hypothetical protein
MRNRLIELLTETFEYTRGVCFDFDEAVQINAEYLLANGVIVPPVRVGDTVWFNTFAKSATVCLGVQPHKIDRVNISFTVGADKLLPTEIPDWSIGKTVFLSRDEAEQALKGGAE